MRRPIVVSLLAAGLVIAGVVLGRASGVERAVVIPSRFASGAGYVDRDVRRGERPDLLAARRLAVPSARRRGVASGDSAGRSIAGTARGDRLVGSGRPEALYGRAGDDTIDARGGDDFVSGGAGRDRLAGGSGNDRIAAVDGRRDEVSCGPGRDLANVDRGDAAAGDCELVLRRVSPAARPNLGEDATQVEPSVAASGTTLVAAYQAWRHSDGGAAATGFAVSKDGAASWRSGILPQPSAAAGLYAFSDPVTAYDARHAVWLIASLGLGENRDAIVVNRSRNGRSWPGPVIAVRDDSLDKDWLACDNWAGSPFRGRCYLAYYNVGANRLEIVVSDDAGQTWSQPVALPRGDDEPYVNGAQPVPRPDGTLVVVYVATGRLVGAEAIMAVTSGDGGFTFAPPVVVSHVDVQEDANIRSPVLPSTAADRTGRVYVSWHDCRFDRDCGQSSAVLSTSANGTSWSSPTLVRRPPGQAGDVFVPAVAVQQGTGGRTAGVAVLYHSIARCAVFAPCLAVDVWLTGSADGGRTWTSPRRLSAQRMRTWWLAETGLGPMLGDYVGLAFSRGLPVPVFSLGAEPIGGSLTQGIVSAVVR